VIGFMFGERGLMANLSLEGAKITRMNKPREEPAGWAAVGAVAQDPVGGAGRRQ
jgi:lipid-binding SYLF domain-containing protein